MLILTRADIVPLFPMEKALEAVRQGAAEYSSGYAEIAAKLRLTVPDVQGEVLVMPGFAPRLSALGLKLVGFFPGNRVLSFPVSPGMLLLLNAKTGVAEALLDATYLTAMRTGATTGVACLFLARGDAEVLGLIGTGWQARTQLEAVVTTRPIREVRVFSRSPEQVARFISEAERRYPAVAMRPVGSGEEAARSADIVVAATTATQPVVLDPWIRPGTLVCGIGTHAPDAAEIAPEIVGRAARVVVDTRHGTVGGVGDIAGPIAAGLCDEAHISELGELVLGRAAGRQSDEEIAVFKSVGFAAVDLASAAMIVGAAREKGAGIELELH